MTPVERHEATLRALDGMIRDALVEPVTWQVDAAVDSATVFALTAHGRTLHLVPSATLRTDTDIIGRSALCGQRVAREVHPSDHYEGRVRVCRRCMVRGGQPMDGASTPLGDGTYKDDDDV